MIEALWPGNELNRSDQPTQTCDLHTPGAAIAVYTSVASIKRTMRERFASTLTSTMNWLALTARYFDSRTGESPRL